jgi:dihydrofolate synthase/folylpolyglutamate synthase
MNTKKAIDQYLEAEDYLNQGLIRTVVPDNPPDITRREWMLRFLDDLGHPEDAFPSVHIAGTSGKGSTAVLLAEILRAAGYKTGLHITPYLQVATEKLWFDGKYASAEEFIDLIDWIKPVCKKWKKPEVPLHGMASFGICLEYFRRKKVDIAVMEAGVGGRDDITNVLNTCLSVITPIGLDHTKTLGETIESIAGHKAGILKPGIPAVVFDGPGKNVISAEAEKTGSPVEWVNPAEIPPGAPKNMPGKFQSTNTHMAKTAARILGKNGYNISSEAISKGITNARIPGRMEKLEDSPEVYIDGAHNHQKLKNLFSEFSSKNYLLIYGMLASKMSQDVLELLKSLNTKVIFTKPQVYGKESLDPHKILQYFPSKSTQYMSSPSKALHHAKQIAGREELILVAGSLYLTGNIREIYYPSRKVLLSRTSWPLSPRRTV